MRVLKKMVATYEQKEGVPELDLINDLKLEKGTFQYKKITELQAAVKKLEKDFAAEKNKV